MSSTNRGAIRHPDDFYRTPGFAVRALKTQLDQWDSVLDPFCGDGAILAEFPDSKRWGIELDEVRADHARLATMSTVINGDAFLVSWEPTQLIVMNPPFSLAMEAVTLALSESKRTGAVVAVLLRLGWTASQERAPFHHEHRSDLYVLPKRPSFAASLKCKANGCGWKATQDLRDARPKTCPKCAGKTACTTSDSADYGWLVFNDGDGGRWRVLVLEVDGVS